MCEPNVDDFNGTHVNQIEKECQSLIDSIYWNIKCDEGMLCDLPTSESSESRHCSQDYAYPGEYCVDNSTCIQDVKCIDNVCVGKGNDEPCSENYECDVGYYCKNNLRCLPQEDFACSKTYDCQNDQVCDGQKCEPYFSIKNNEKCIKDEFYNINDFSWACSSMYCNGYACYDAAYNQVKEDYVCQQNSECQLRGTTVQYGSCECPVVKQELGMQCKVELGDPEAITFRDSFIDHLKNNFKNIVQKCHTERRFTYQCWKNHTDIYQSLAQNGVFSYDFIPLINKRIGPENITFDTLANMDYEFYYNVDQLSIQTCKKYGCTNDFPDLTLEQDQCLKEESDTVISDECKTESRPYCETKTVNQNENSNQDIMCDYKQLENFLAYPGMFCRSHEYCVTNNCYHFRCIGLQEGESCESSEDSSCDVGLACVLYSSVPNDTYTCQKQIETENEDRECENSYQCVNSAACYGGRCYTYLSQMDKFQFKYQPDKKTLNDDLSKKMEICSSFTYEQIDDDNSECVSNYRSVVDDQKDLPLLATNTWTCRGDHLQNYLAYANVNCGYDIDGQSYCGAHTGDNVAQDYLDVWSAIIGKDNGICHSYARYEKNCWDYEFKLDDLDLFYKYLVAKFEYEHYPVHLKAETCTLKVLFSEYYQAKAGQHYPREYPVLECSHYQCTSLEKDTCTQFESSNDTYMIQSCEKNSWCKLEQNKGSNKCTDNNDDQYQQLIGSYPGMKCLSDANCANDLICSGEKCTGKSTDDQCSGPNDYTCPVGKACIQNEESVYTCQSQIKEGKDCESDYQCVNYALCRENKCVKYFSLKTNETYDFACPSSLLEYACETFSCKYITANSSECTDTFLPLENVTECAFDYDCLGYNQEENAVYTTCQCGKDIYSTAYCGAHTGQNATISYIESFKKIYEKDQGKCHSFARRNFDCWAQKGLNGKDQQEFIVYDFEYNHYPIVQLSDDCIVETYYQAYSEAKDEMSAFTIRPYSLVVIFLLYFFF